MLSPRTLMHAFAVVSLGLLFAGNAQALFASFDGDSLHGSEGTLTVVETDAATGTFSITWELDTTGFSDGAATNTDRYELTSLGFKAFDSYATASLDSLTSISGDHTATFYADGSLSNGGCQDDPDAGFTCATDFAPSIDARIDQTIIAQFTVTGGVLNEEEWSFRGAYGPNNGWVISESSQPIPEPGAALVFGAGLMTVSTVSRRMQR